jgi:folylpolyglutamate synthase/dihydrofolate synthase
VSFSERIRVSGRAISRENLDRHIERLFPRFRDFVATHGPDSCPSLFEALMVVAFSVFEEAGVRAAIFEAAIGGSNDATSLLPATFSIVTSVGLDHQPELGDTLEDIARDKAGIAADGGILVVAPGIPSLAIDAVRSECNLKNVRCIDASDETMRVIDDDLTGQKVCIRDDALNEVVRLPFPGDHQLFNLSTVWASVKLLEMLGHVSSCECIHGVRHARIPGRSEYIQGKPSWLLDVAHNVDSIRALIATVRKYLQSERVVVIMGATAEHDFRQFLPLLGAVADRIGFCEGFYRSVPYSELAKCLSSPATVIGAFATPDDAVDLLCADTRYESATIVVTGSLFLVGAWRLALERRSILSGNW